MNEEILSKQIKTNPFIVYIDSNQRLNGTNTSFNYRLNIPPDNIYSKVIITRAIIPKTYYNVASPYNKFTLTENGLSATVTLAESDYSMTQSGNSPFITSLISALNASSVSLGHNYIYTITFPNERLSPQTGKFTFNVSNNGGIQPIFTFAIKSLYEQLGFNQNSVNTFSGNTLISPNVIYLQSERSLFIHSDIIQNYNDNILQEIYVGPTPSFSSIIFNQLEYNLNAKQYAGKESNSFLFRISDENDEDINLNGVSWNFTLLIF